MILSEATQTRDKCCMFSPYVDLTVKSLGLCLIQSVCKIQGTGKGPLVAKEKDFKGQWELERE